MHTFHLEVSISKGRERLEPQVVFGDPRVQVDLHYKELIRLQDQILTFLLQHRLQAGKAKL